MKPKHKASPANFLARFWRGFLFTRAFEFKTDLPLEQSVAALRRIAETNRMSWGYSEQRTIRIDEKQLPYTFHAETRRQQKNRDHTSTILVDGMIDWDGDSSRTIISGTARFAPAYYLGLLGKIGVIVYVAITPMPTSSRLLIAIFMMIYSSVYWWSLYWERNSLVAGIEQVLRDAETVAHLSKRKVDASLSDVDVWADSFPSQKAKIE